MSFVVFLFFFFKQKTAYEMRISDWSSDVCSSDLALHRSASVGRQLLLWLTVAAFAFRAFMPVGFMPDVRALQSGKLVLTLCTAGGGTALITLDLSGSEERRVGEECVSTCSSRWSPVHYKQNKQKKTQHTHT